MSAYDKTHWNHNVNQQNTCGIIKLLISNFNMLAISTVNTGIVNTGEQVQSANQMPMLPIEFELNNELN